MLCTPAAVMDQMYSETKEDVAWVVFQHGTVYAVRSFLFVGNDRRCHRDRIFQSTRIPIPFSRWRKTS